MALVIRTTFSYVTLRMGRLLMRLRTSTWSSGRAGGRQQPLDKARIRSLRSASEGLGLVQAFSPSSTCESRRPSGLAALLSASSCIDMAFVPLGSSSSAAFCWDGALGDHGFVYVDVRDFLVLDLCVLALLSGGAPTQMLLHCM